MFLILTKDTVDTDDHHIKYFNIYEDDTNLKHKI